MIRIQNCGEKIIPHFYAIKKKPLDLVDINFNSWMGLIPHMKPQNQEVVEDKSNIAPWSQYSLLAIFTLYWKFPFRLQFLERKLTAT